MAFWVTALLFIASTAAQYLLRPKPKIDAPRPSGESDFNLPSIEEGRPMNLWWGTCKLTNPTMLNAIGYHSVPIPEGQAYYLANIWAWGIGPADAVESLQWDDLEATIKDRGTYDPPYTIGASIEYPILREDWPDRLYGYIYSPQLWGGHGGEGGVFGYYDFMWGTTDQPINVHSSQYVLLVEDWSRYPQLCYSLTFHHAHTESFYIGTVPYLKPHAAVLRRTPNTLNLPDGQHNIDGDANPACILHEIMTNEVWGLGTTLLPWMIDVEAFQAAGATLASEGLGLSLQSDSHTDAEEIIKEVLRHIDGVITTDATTGLVTLKLIRNDYDPDTILHLDDNDILELEEFTRPGLDTLSNRVIVRFLDKQRNHVRKPAIEENLALIHQRQGVYPQDLDFLGIRKAEIAQQIAARELKYVSHPFAAIKFSANRRAWRLRPGDPFKFSYSPLGIDGMVCRVVNVSHGPVEDGKIRLEVAEDAFGVDWTTYNPPASSKWEYPIPPP